MFLSRLLTCGPARAFALPLACGLSLNSGLCAADLFVATTGVNDNAAGRGLSVGAPYLTIDYAADRATPGSTVYIRGGTYRETVTPSASGTANAPIVFKPYNNESVVLSGLNLITPGSGGAGTWSVDSGSIYKIQLTANFGSDSNFSKDRITGCQVFVNGEAMSEARWPNSPTPMGIRRTEAATALSGAYTPVGVAGSYIYDALYRNAGLDAFAADIWKNGIIVFAPGSQWYRRVATISGNTPGGASSEVRFSFNPYSEASNREDTDIGDPFFLMGRKVALDAEKEFFFDTLQGATSVDGRDGPRHMLYLRMPGSVTPEGQVVEMRRRQYALNLTDVSDLQFENLRIVGARIKTSTTTSNLTFRSLNVNYPTYTWQEELGDGYNSMVIEGSGHQILDSSLTNTSHGGISFSNGSGNLVKNTVISECFLSAIEMKDTSSNIRAENVTVFNLAGYGISGNARPNQVLYSHGYNGGLFITDAGTINAGGSFDGLGSEWAYNWVHDAVGSANSARDWYGTPAIRLDSGPTNFMIHHNLVWNTTQPGSAISIWAISSGKINYQDAKIQLYNNSVDQQIGLTETVNNPASLKGMDLSNNLTGVGMGINSSSTDAAGKLYITDLVAKNNLFPNRNIPDDPTPPHSANRQGATGWTAPASPPSGYQLSSSSQAINNGVAILGITDGYIGSAPDIGALEAGLKPFTPGAKVRAQDLAGLVVTPTVISNAVRFVVTGLPVGRSLPDSFRLKIAANAASGDFTQSFDFVNHTVTPTFNALSVPGAGQGVEVSLDGTTFITLPATVTVPASTLAATNTSLAASANPTPVGTPVTFTATVTTGSGTTAGNVTFLDGFTTLGTAALNGSGVATLTASVPGSGLHSITASYAGSASRASSVSAILLQTISPGEITPAGVVRARFTDSSLAFQQFPGAAGDGWLAGWTATSLASGVVQPSPELVTGSVNHLKVARSGGTTSQEGVSRPWSGALPTDPRPFDEFSRLTFDIRLDSPNSTFENAADVYSVTLNNITGASPGNFSTIYLRTFGATPAGTTIQPREWCVFNGDPGIANGYDVTKFRRTGVFAQQGVTCSFTVDIFAAAAAGNTAGKVHGTYDVTVSNGTQTGTILGSGFRAAAYSSGGFMAVGSQQNLTTDNLAFSIDSVEMTALPMQATSTALASNANPANPGASVVFTATVTSTSGVPAGSVTFLDGTTPIGTGNLNVNGTATLTTTSLSAGPHSITAAFAGNVVHAASTSPPISQTIRFPTTTSLATNANPAAFGASVTLTATVTGGSGIPGGTVTFLDGVASLGTGTLNASGVATFSTSSLSIGTHPITANYGGDASNSVSTSPVVSQVIQPIVTATALASSANPAALGASVTFTATVTGASGTPAGSVTFFDGAATLGTGTLNGSGIATLVTGSLSVGSHAITVNYGGNSNHAASTSSVVSQVIQPRSTLTTIASSANPAVAGASITFTATVTSSFGTPGGNVTFFDGVASLGTGTLDGSGVATLATITLTPGSHSITASYGGSTNHLASTSSILSQVINPFTTTTTLAASANPASLGASVTLTATVAGAPGTPAGNVTFLDGAANLGSGTLNASGIATFVTSALTVGSHPLTAAYNPAGNHAASVSSVLSLQIVTLYDAWLAGAFTPAELANPALEASVWGPLADPDADGSTNLLEYGLGTDPTANSSVARPVHSFDLAGHLTVSFPRISDPALFYQVSGSDGLATWAEVWSSTGAQNVAGSVTVTDTALPGVPSRFLVLRISKP